MTESSSEFFNPENNPLCSLPEDQLRIFRLRYADPELGRPRTIEEMAALLGISGAEYWETEKAIHERLRGDSAQRAEDMEAVRQMDFVGQDPEEVIESLAELDDDIIEAIERERIVYNTWFAGPGDPYLRPSNSEEN